MTKKLMICLVVFGVLAVPAFAQKAEVFGGYQYTRLDGGWNGNGWNAAATMNLNHWFGLTGDFTQTFTTHWLGGEPASRALVDRHFGHQEPHGLDRRKRGIPRA